MKQLLILTILFICTLLSSSCDQLTYDALDPQNSEGSALQYLRWAAYAVDALPPGIESTSPTQSEADADPMAGVRIVFSETMADESLNRNTIQVFLAGESVPGSVGYDSDNRTAVFTPDSGYLESGGDYVATVSRDVKDLAGNGLEDDYSFNFSIFIDEAVPRIVSSVPAQGATNILETEGITVAFSEELDPATINASTVRLLGGGHEISGVLTYSGKALSFMPGEKLDYKVVYTLTFSSDVRDPAGNSIAAGSELSFETRGVAFLFKTEEWTKGDFGGRAPADSMCQKAYSDSYTSLRCNHIRGFLGTPGTDLNDFPRDFDTPDDIEIRGHNGTLIAYDWDDLVDNSIMVTLREAGVIGREFWFGTMTGGSGTDLDCSNWTNRDGGGNWGTTGNADAKDWTFYWGSFPGRSCSDELPLVCVCWR